jgi:hypothetical protein
MISVCVACLPRPPSSPLHSTLSWDSILSRSLSLSLSLTLVELLMKQGGEADSHINKDTNV